jgi:hypothetical protein
MAGRKTPASNPADVFLNKYRKLRPLAENLKRKGHTKHLFDVAGFRGLFSSEKNAPAPSASSPSIPSGPRTPSSSRPP